MGLLLFVVVVVVYKLLCNFLVFLTYKRAIDIIDPEIPFPMYPLLQLFECFPLVILDIHFALAFLIDKFIDFQLVVIVQPTASHACL